MAPRRKKAARSAANGESGMVPLDFNKIQLPWESNDALDALIERQQRAAGAVGGWPFISTKGGIFSVGDVELEEFDCFVLAHARMNSYFAGAYNPNKTDSPDCYAIQGMEQLEGDMAPPADLAGREADKCGECPQNEFGSDTRGRGKACKNVHCLGLIVVEGGITPATIAQAKGLRLRIPPTSKKWSEVVDYLSAKRVPLPFAQMHFSIVEDEDTQFQIMPFPTTLANTPELQQALLSRAEEADRQIRIEPPKKAQSGGSAAPRKKTARKAGGKKAKTVRRRSASR